MVFKHKFVQELWKLIEAYMRPKDVISHPLLAAIWFGIRREVPNILKSLDENPEAIAAISEKFRALLEEEPKLEEKDAGDKVE